MSQKLREMLDKRNQLITDARALVDRAEQENRQMHDDEKTQYDALMKEAVDLRENIDREQKLIDEEKRAAEEGLRFAANGDGVKPPATPEAEVRTAALRNFFSGGVSEMNADERRTLMAGQDSGGGFITTPQEFMHQLIAAVKNFTFIRGLATGFTSTNANGMGFPTLDTDVDDFEWSTEIKTATEDTSMEFGKRELKPHPAKKLIKISDLLLRSDGLNAEAIAMDRIAYKKGITEEKAFLTGTGNQQPLGLFVASAVGINTDRDLTCTAAVADVISADDLKRVKYNEKAQYMTKAQWLFHRDMVSVIARLKDGEGRYIFEMANALGAVDNLMGRPLSMSEYVPNTLTASQYVGMFGDFSWYWILDRLSMRIKRLNELYAATSQVGFIIDWETDAMPVLSEAFTRIKLAAA